MNEPDNVVLSSVDRDVATITLNRPERSNAVNGHLSRALNRALDAAANAPEVRVILITGSGKAFCAGADVKVLDEYAADPAAPNSGSGKLRYSTLMQVPKPVIAAVNGACAGVGLALACCADIRLASTNAFFLAPFVRLGLTAELGLGWLLPRLVGVGNTMHLLMAAGRIAAEEAHAMGLVSAVLPDATFAAEAHAYACAMAEGSAPTALAAIKRQVYRGLGQSFADAEAEAFRLTFESLEGSDFKEAIAARTQGRRPEFALLGSQRDPAR